VNTPPELTAGLNPAQRDAVLHTEGPLLILAGAGAGKTKVITHRIGALIASGVAPAEILAVTFTNKAAKEMRERVSAMLHSGTTTRPYAGERPFVSTFHSLGVHILKENSRALDIPRNFTIFDRSDSSRAIKEALQSAGFDPKEFEPRRILSAISREKGKGLTRSAFAEVAGRDFFKRLVLAVWEHYDQILAKEKALDFDDLLLRTLSLLRDNSAIRDYYQGMWRYIHVDEYQDTNGVQYELMQILAGKHKNICVVGDIDQNIYSWRGADLEHMLHFEEDYPKARVILLEENYRSTKTILAAANDIIRKNVRRKEKNLFTKNPEGEKISLYSSYDEIDEARFITQTSAELIKKGVSPNEIAVLYRANFQSRVIEEAMLAENLPYQVLGVRFFERKEVKDMLSYLRLALGSENVSDIKRVYNFPPRGIGKVTMLKILEGKTEALPAAMRSKIAGVKSVLERINVAAGKLPPSEVVKTVVTESGIEAHLRKGTEEDLERLENIRELVTLASRYDHLPVAEGLEAFLADAALQSEQDELDEKKSAIRLMTVHAAKGLEFEYVFIAGLEEGLFPHEGLGDETRDNEEERRLFYVALTRARRKLFISYASMRTLFGARQVNVPSEFITDLPEDLIEIEEPHMPRRVIYLD